MGLPAEATVPIIVFFAVFGLVIVIILIKLGVIGWILHRRKHTPRIALPISGIPARNAQINGVAPPASILPDASSHNEKRYTFLQIVQITDNFTTKLGRGGFGTVFLGKMPDGRSVAVKRLSAQSEQGSSEFQNEVDILLRVHHRNLVSLIGYCEELEERILIYEYLQNGSLEDHLRRRNNGTASMPPLGWEIRIRIAVDAANGLKYLHTDCNPKIVHRDVKSSNILLDAKLTAKVADFGLSKSFPEETVSHITQAVQGTYGYLDPEYANGLDRLTNKSDVYSFGVVLLELLTGVEPIKHTDSGFCNISQWARPHILSENVNEIIDKSLGGEYNIEAFKALSLLALKCVEIKGVNRPAMKEVSHQLELIVETYLKPSRSTLEYNGYGSAHHLESLNSMCTSQVSGTSTMPLLRDMHGHNDSSTL